MEVVGARRLLVHLRCAALVLVGLDYHMIAAAALSLVYRRVLDLSTGMGSVCRPDAEVEGESRQSWIEGRG